MQDFILEHYSEDSYLYENEIADLMDLRQVRFRVQRDGEETWLGCWKRDSVKGVVGVEERSEVQKEITVLGPALRKL